MVYYYYYTEAPKRTITFFFAGKINIINKHHDGITNVKISHDLGMHATMFRVSFPYSFNISDLHAFCIAIKMTISIENEF